MFMIAKVHPTLHLKGSQQEGEKKNAYQVMEERVEVRHEPVDEEVDGVSDVALLLPRSHVLHRLGDPSTVESIESSGRLAAPRNAEKDSNLKDFLKDR